MSVSAQMSTWKDFLKTPEEKKKMSKPKESKVTMTRRKPAPEEALSEAQPSSVHDDDGSPTLTEATSEEDVPKSSPQRSKNQTRATKPAQVAPPDEEEDESEDGAPIREAQYQVVSYKKKVQTKTGPSPSQLFGKFCDESLYTKKGIIFNILNNQCHGTSQYVRALRIDLDDPTQLNRYLETNLPFLKQTATLHTHDYFLLSRVCLGMAQDLTVDEYSPSFTFASLSDEGKDILPNGEEEGPIWFSMFPSLLQKTKLRTLPDGSIDEAYIVNFRVHQVNTNIRIRNPDTMSQPSGKGSRRNNRFVTVVDPSSKKTGNSTGPRTGATIVPPPIKISKPFGPSGSHGVQEAYTLAVAAQELSRSALHQSKEAQREIASLRSDKIYPSLPETPAPRWPTSDVIPPLPDTY